MNTDTKTPERAKAAMPGPKVAYTFRTRYRRQLQLQARREERTVSNLVGIAVAEFLARREEPIDNWEI